MKKSVALILLMLLISPLAVFSAEKINEVSREFFDALDKQDLSRLQSLLSPNFQYHYYEGNTLKVLGRNVELRGLQKLFDEANIEVRKIEVRNQKEEIKDQCHVKFEVFFKDSPKDTKSFFWSSGLAMDETLVVTFENRKIAKIVEMKRTGMRNRLSFGHLKSIYSKETVSEWRGNGSEEKAELFDKHSHELLLWKKEIRDNNGFKTNLYFPNNKKIDNLLY